MGIEKHNILYHRCQMLPFLKHLEGKKNSYEYIIRQFWCSQFLICLSFLFNTFPKELRKAIREDPETDAFVKRGVHIRRNEV
jgi:hypothetical protein